MKPSTTGCARLPISRWTALAAAVLAIGLPLCGCGGYRLGPSNGLSAREQSVFVEPFVNETQQPRLEDDVTHAVRLNLQREGTYRLGHRGDCDIVVKGVITGYSRQGLSYNPVNLNEVVDYNLVAIAHVTAYERRTGKLLLDQNFAGDTQVRATADLASAEREVTPMLANRMARKVVDSLADGSW